MAHGQLKRTKELVEQAWTILEQERPMTIRQLFYRLVSVKAIENRQSDYKLVSRLMKTARIKGSIPWEWIVDRTRPTYAPTTWNNLEEYAEVVQGSYRRDNWQNQPYHVEIWVEKDTVVGSIAELADEFAVTVRAMRGFGSTTKTHDIAVLLSQIEKPKIILYLGDHDPSGQDIERDLKQRVQEYGSGAFDLIRLAIHRADIEKFDLPPLRVKETDTRAKGFRREHGDECVELDALPPDVLRGRIRAALEAIIDQEAWMRAMLLEAAQRETTRMLANTLRSLPLKSAQEFQI